MKPITYPYLNLGEPCRECGATDGWICGWCYVEDLLEALKFYADEDNWRERPRYDKDQLGHHPPAHIESGERAREALRRYKV